MQIEIKTQGSGKKAKRELLAFCRAHGLEPPSFVFGVEEAPAELQKAERILNIIEASELPGGVKIKLQRFLKNPVIYSCHQAIELAKAETRENATALMKAKGYRVSEVPARPGTKF